MKKHLTCLALAAGLLSACQTSNQQNDLTVTYRFEDKKQDNQFVNHFIIYNHSDQPLSSDWTLYYSQMPRGIQQDDAAQAKVSLINANYFKIAPTESYQPIAAGDSLVLTFYTNSGVTNTSTYPEGMYIVKDNDNNNPSPIELTVDILSYAKKHYRFDAQKVFQDNAQLTTTNIERTPYDILPTVKSASLSKGSIDLGNEVNVVYEDSFTDEATLLKDKLQSLYQISINKESPVTIKLSTLSDTQGITNNELYHLTIRPNEVEIAGSTAHGVFNGCQTLLALLKGKATPYTLEQMEIIDYPDLAYRGMMLDIARNFTSVDNLKSLLDVLATYKINRLHLHPCDDEGWRLEIPGLEELTSVGSKRGHTLDESTHLFPCYDGNFDPQAPTSGNGFYTREEFIDLLKYAKTRHIEIITEIDSPGHARAAIKAMNARYHNYIDTDQEKAEEFLLCDFEDKSEYKSAQWYTDNVMNVALPSTYRFLDKVFGELSKMYQEAGASLESIHIGGDEVPRGAWLKSPQCLALMEQTGMKTTKELQEYYFAKANEILLKHNLKMSGWQEVAHNNSTEIDKQLIPNIDGIYCWNTVPEWKGDIIPYTAANKGYSVVLSNVNNLYIDLAYSPHPQERGLSWGGYVDESKTFSILPLSIYKSARTNLAGDPVDIDHAAQGKVVLKDEAKDKIKGVQVQLFAETIREYAGVEYYVFPKILGMVERGWNAHPTWETLQGDEDRAAYTQDLSLFYAKLSDLEYPYLAQLGINFRVPHPGISVDDGMLSLNAPIRGAEIRYTLDGTEPTTNSALWTEPVAIETQTIQAKLYYQGKESVTSTYTRK